MKILPKTTKSAKGFTLISKAFKESYGFTLIELLVIIAILAILAVIGFAVIGSASGKARDSKKRADIDEIAKAYEVNYDSVAGTYPALAAGQFTAGVIPVPPDTPSYTYVAGPNATTLSADTFTVCATLGGGTAGCTAPSGTCYCRSAAQGTTAAAAPAPAPTTCANFNGQAVNTSQICGSISIAAGSTIYVKCADLTANLVCNNTCTSLSTPYYLTAAATTAQIATSVYRGVCGVNSITVTLRAP